jgi:endonuclease III
MGALPRHTTPGARRAAPALASVVDRARRAAEIGRRLAARWPDAVCELDHASAFQLLVGTILAAQSTDRLVNTITPVVLARWPDPAAMAAADPTELEQVIHSTGFFRMKARHLLGMARAVVERHGGEVPRTMAELVALPGVARKTANVVLSTIWGIAEGVVVDTHVTRLSQRLGLSAAADPTKIEHDLMAILPRDQWGCFADRVIWHGRRVCHARQPTCDDCELAPLCPSSLVPVSAAVAPRTGSA